MKPSERTARTSASTAHLVPPSRQGGKGRRVSPKALPSATTIAAALRAHMFGYGSTAVLSRNADGQWWVSDHAIVPAQCMVTYRFPTPLARYRAQNPDYYKAGKTLLDALRAKLIAKALADDTQTVVPHNPRNEQP
jgi:hypothetical protein